MVPEVSLSRNQREIMMEFYSVPAQRVLLNKAERTVLWNEVKKNRAPESVLQMAKAKCPALHHQIVRHEKEAHNVQSAVFSECVYAQALAEVFALPVFRRADALK